MSNIRVILLIAMLITSSSANSEIALRLLGTYESGFFNESALEIAAFDPESKCLFAVNGNMPTFDIIDISDPVSPIQIRTVDISRIGASANSIAHTNGILVAAIEGAAKTDDGKLAFFDIEGTFINAVRIGPLPDMVCITPDGSYALVANEGEPNLEYTLDPEGSVSIVPLSGDLSKLNDSDVKTINFRAYNTNPPKGLRIVKPGATVAQDVEPEYIGVSEDSKTAWVALQENNTIAVIDIPSATITKLLPLGTKDHSIEGNGFDAVKDDKVDIRTWPTHGLYQPDAIAILTRNGRNYILTANEGDSRDWEGFSEETKVGKLNLDPNAFPSAAELQAEDQLGGLLTTTTAGDIDGDGDHDIIYSLGARSFSVWDESGTLLFDSGDEFERVTGEHYPKMFNSSNNSNDSADSRSDDKGPEPEGIVIGQAFGKTLAFIGLERIGGVMIYDLANPEAPKFLGYTNHRNFKGDPEAGLAGPLGPEGLVFIPAEQSPNNKPLLIVVNEISGTISITEITEQS